MTCFALNRHVGRRRKDQRMNEIKREKYQKLWKTHTRILNWSVITWNTYDDYDDESDQQTKKKSSPSQKKQFRCDVDTHKSIYYSLGGILRFSVVGRWDRIVGYVDGNNFTLFQLFGTQLVDLQKREIKLVLAKLLNLHLRHADHGEKRDRRGLKIWGKVAEVRRRFLLFESFFGFGFLG